MTGGEPLVRKGLAGFIRSLVGLKGADDISLTTNGILLKDHLDELRDAGLRRINISLDTLDPATYAEITGGGRLSSVLEAIDGALEKGFAPVKINVVLLKGKNDDFSRVRGPRPGEACPCPVHRADGFLSGPKLFRLMPRRPGPARRVRPAGGGRRRPRAPDRRDITRSRE